MRIGIYAPNLATPAPSGVERCVISLVRALASAESDHEFVLFSDWDPGPTPPRWRRVALPSMGRWARLRFDHSGLARRAREERLDLVHATKSFLPAGLGCPGVVSVYDVIFLRHPGFYPFLWRAYWTRALARSVERAAAISCLSETTERDLHELLPASRGKTQVVPPGVDPGLFRGAAVDGPPCFLCVGNLTRRKNLPVLIEAFARVRKTRPVELVVVGALDYGGNALEGDGVRYLERVPDQDLGRLYRSAIALVYPSQYEGFGLPVLEAMSAGCPVIASSGGALPEAVGEAGLLVPPGSPEDLAGAMERVAADPDLRRRLADQGRARAARFTWERAAERTLELYERAARRPHAERHETLARP